MEERVLDWDMAGGDKCGGFINRLDSIYEKVTERSLALNAKRGYSARIWFPVPNQQRSVYGRYGNVQQYGDEKWEVEEWDSPQLDQRIGQDRADEEFKPAEIIQQTDPDEPDHPDPDWEGRVIVSGLEQNDRYLGDLTGDPYGVEGDLKMVVPVDLPDIPSNSKVEITARTEILHFHTGGVKVEIGQWGPKIRRVSLYPAEDERLEV